MINVPPVQPDTGIVQVSGVTVLTAQTVAGVGRSDFAPARFALEQNYPNPFNPITIIRYTVPRSIEVSLTIYNLLGQKIATLVDEEQSAGIHETRFDGSGLSSGFYFYRLNAGGFTGTKTLLLVK